MNMKQKKSDVDGRLEEQKKNREQRKWKICDVDKCVKH